MVRFSYVVYLKPNKKSRFYKSLERYLMSSLAHFGLHEGTMCPQHCELKQFFGKGDYLPAVDTAQIMDRRRLRITLDLKHKSVGGLV
ncbi:hypothetical protein R1sor_009412 [Riccia sorocarpa]|uniref:Uncharacterized protein n=1 Tax=Riccia sorocarpa TaxID=122646 RepID=A0ABD3HZ53_9MARC